MFNQRSGRLAALSGRPVNLAVTLRSRTWLPGTEGGGTTPPEEPECECRGEGAEQQQKPSARAQGAARTLFSAKQHKGQCF